MKRARFVLFLILVIKINQSMGQFGPCKNDDLIDPFFFCGTDFRPVCACDNQTYRNECAAIQHGGIQGNQWVSGPCQEFYFNLLSNPVAGTIIMQFQFQQSGTATLQVVNMNGRVVYQQFISLSNNFPQRYELSLNLIPGFYFVSVTSQTYRQVQRFSLITP